MVIKTASCLADIHQGMEEQDGQVHVLNFFAPWADACKQMNEIISVYSETKPEIIFWNIDAEKVADATMNYMVEAVPTLVFIRDKKELSRVNGSHPDEFISTIESIGSSTEEKEEMLNKRMLSLINKGPIMVFIKGTPSSPRCGFTRQLVSILSEQGVQYDYFDILQDEEIRQSLKKFSDWPTYPQIYIKGDFVGGLDIFKEMVTSGQFREMTN